MGMGQHRPALHEFNPPLFDDERSPCPALNALANHSYLPHDGRDIGFWKSVNALRDVYNLSLLLAVVLTVAGCLLCGPGAGTFTFRSSFSLSDLAQHGKIEHDGSLSRPDARQGSLLAPCPPDPARLASLCSENADSLTLDDMCRVRAARDAQLRQPLSLFHAEVARGEVALTYGTFARADGRVLVSDLLTWFGQDRLPYGWSRPRETQGLLATMKRAKRVRGRVAEIRKSE
ncbi:heme-thiolate peroxidase [Auricularia subglabra TFB-10046 SS5]|nr:heme-thiolate peroxidase [Auricularia subglabra TFB-10046 SS5]